MSDAKKRKIILIGIGVLILGLIVTANLFLNTLQGHYGASDSIKEAKRRGVFICEYQAIKNPIIINDTLQIEVKRGWLEKRWGYPKNLNETIIIDGYQLIVETKNEVSKGFSIDWTIGVDAERYIRPCGRNCIMTDFESMPKDTEIWKVQQGYSLNDSTPKRIIGEFALVKKK